MSGRSGRCAGVGTLLEVNPILTLRNEKLEMLERIRTRVKPGRTIELAIERPGSAVEQLAILHSMRLSGRSSSSTGTAALPCPPEMRHCGNDARPVHPHQADGLVGLVLVKEVLSVINYAYLIDGH